MPREKYLNFFIYWRLNCKAGPAGISGATIGLNPIVIGTPGRGLGHRAKLEGSGRAEDGLPAFVGPSVDPSHGHPCPPGPGVVVPAREQASLGKSHELARPYN